MYSSNQNYDANSRLSETQMPPSAPPQPVSHEYNPPAATGIPVGYSSNSTGTPATWSTGLCDCSSDVSNCCLTCWCPCITFGQITDIVDKGSTSRGGSVALYAVISVVTGCTCCYSAIYRTKLRRQYNLPETPCGDCLVHCCCEPCALCQEHRELRHRGFDMSLGWEGNMEKQNGGVAMAPMPHGGMSR